MRIILLVPCPHPVEPLDTLNDQQAMGLAVTQQLTLSVPFLYVLCFLSPIFLDELFLIHLVRQLIVILFSVPRAIIDQIEQEVHAILAVPAAARLLVLLLTPC